MRQLLILLVFTLLLLCGKAEGMCAAAKQEPPIPREKIYLHTDKTTYNTGEDIWFKVYLVDAKTHQPDVLSRIVYVDLLNNKNQIISSRRIKMDESCGTGDFKLSMELGIGVYTIRAFTNYMKNFDTEWFFRKTLFINSLNSNMIANFESLVERLNEKSTDSSLAITRPNLQFFPDGGYMVDGLVNQIGFKAIGPDGKAIDLTGTIVDSSGDHVLDFQTLKFGMGMFKFVPQPDHRYIAHVADHGEKYSYDLPVSLTKGVVMQIIEQKDAFAVILNSTLPGGVNNFKLIVSQRNRHLGCSEIANTQSGAKIVIPKNILEQGIAQFTLSDNNGSPVCERLVFVEGNDTIRPMNISTAKTEYGKEELVELLISPSQVGIQNIKAKLSVAVTNRSDSENYNIDIQSYLLLKSDLKGEIEHPGYYFHSTEPQRKMALDVLMMTQGWRQFIIGDTLPENNRSKFSIENGISFAGNIRRFNYQEKPSKALVTLSYRNRKNLVNMETETDDKGHFIFDDVDLMDSTTVYFQAKTLKERKSGKEDLLTPNRNLFIVMDTLLPPDEPFKKTVAPQDANNHLQGLPSQAESDPAFQVQKGDILIGDVLVSAKKIDKDAVKRSMYFEPSNHLDFKELRNTGARNILEAMDGRLPGVSIDGESVVIRGIRSVSGGSEPLFLLDGMPVSMSTILSFPVDNIDYIDVLKGSKTIIYGSSGSKGVIAVYSLNTNDLLKNSVESKPKGILNIKYPGFSKARKFYQPIYPSVNKNDQQEGSTIYWNPDLISREQDNIKISFLTPDFPGTYQIELEGITNEGSLIHCNEWIKVK